tara:strand:+ start:652 stop:921 length:270 start_codon:yes stop_codon:yes gene_type:complete
MIALADNAWVFFGVIVATVLAPTWLAWWNTHTAKADREQLAAQLLPNGGSSMRDAIDRIEANMANFNARLINVEDYITKPQNKPKDGHA